MTKRTDTQRVILSAASQRIERLALPLPKSLKDGTAHKVVNALIDKGLLKEVTANRKLGDRVWRKTGEGHSLNLIVTKTGFAAIGIEVEPQKTKAQKSEPKPATTERKTREGTKQARVIEMLRRAERESERESPRLPKQRLGLAIRPEAIWPERSGGSAWPSNSIKTRTRGEGIISR